MDHMTTDYIVVGGGLSGCPVASRLSQSDDKPEVILLEAGTNPAGNPATSNFLSGLSLLGSELDYAYPSEPVSGTANRIHYLNAGKALGGGSILNFGSWMRADAADYNQWAEAAGDKRWSYEGLKPWLTKSECFYDPREGAQGQQEYGTDGPMHVTPISTAELGARIYPLRETVKQSWAEIGVHPNIEKDGSTTGLSEMLENSRNGLRQPSNVAYPLDEVKVVTNAVVHRVTFVGTRATGVELSDGRKIIARKEVILCTGAYRTPQILMLSGIGPSAILEEHGISTVYESPQVGQNLHDHFAIFLAFRLRDPSLGYALGSAGFQNPAFSKGFPWDLVACQPVPEEIIIKNGAKTDLKKRNFYEVITAYVPPNIPGIPVDGTHIATSTMLLLPTSRGTVSIRSSSPNDLPCIQPNYLSTTLDRDALVHATRQTLRVLLTTESMKAIVENESPPSGNSLDGLTPLTEHSSDELIEERIRLAGTQHHHSGGTAAMGKVVDGEGKVLGVQALRVADASIIPVPLGGHPQSTLYAMAEQIAYMVMKGS
ncbi:choline dehydrogenase [Hypoxylon crocopeplum]|nr:choline dehydrogenase [Hypoxylon crocopeplum]